MLRCFGIFMLCCIAALKAHGIEFTLRTINGDALLQKSPLLLEMGLVLNEQERETIRAVWVEFDDVAFRIAADSDYFVDKSEKRQWLSPSNKSWRAEFSQSGEARTLLTFGIWHSTDLPPGKYDVTCEIRRIHEFGHDTVLGTERKLLPPTKLTFSISILPRNDSALREEYAALLARARSEKGGRDSVDARRVAVDQLVFTDDPIALDYRLRLLAGDVTMRNEWFSDCTATELVTILSASDDVSVATGLVEVLKELEARTDIQPFVQNVLRGLVLWGIHEMHENGNADVRAATEAIVSAHERPRDPRPVPGLD